MLEPAAAALSMVKPANQALWGAAMTNLASIEAEASQLVGRLPEPQRRTLQRALADVCETRWRELRGREPATPLARALWAIAPPPSCAASWKRPKRTVTHPPRR